MSPLYEYVCEKCGARFEARNSIIEREHTNCPNCKCISNKTISVVNNSFGWRLDDQSHLEFHSDNLERNI